MLNQDALDFIQANTPFAQNLLMALARIPSPSLHEEKRARFCKALLESWGARDAYIDEALNVVLPMDIDSGKPLVVFTAHSDVVFPDTSALPLRDDGERLFCPGIGDNTANLTTLLLCLKYIISRHLQPRKYGVLFVANSGEEGLGNLKGIRRIDGDYGSRIKEFYSFDGKMNGITDHAVGSKRFRVTVRTAGGHSFSGFGSKNAIAELASIIGDIYHIQLPQDGIATYNVGTITGGLSINSIPAQASLLCEFRADSLRNMKYLDKCFRNIFLAHRQPDVGVEVEELGCRPCEALGFFAEKRRQEMVQAARETIRRYNPNLQVFLCSGSTDCNIPLSNGIPSVCFGFYSGAGAHTRNEYLWKSSLVPGYKVCFDTVLPYFQPAP